MSTRSLIGTVDPDTGRYRGRYIHFDGYPTHMGRALSTLVARDGAATVVETLLGRHAWSQIDPAMPDLTGIKPDNEADYGTPERRAVDFAPKGRYADRAAWVTGYGVAHTKDTNDEWFTGRINRFKVTNDDGTWCEWWYVFDGTTPESHLVVLDLSLDTVLTRIRLTDLADTDWGKVECGEKFERCCHYAWAHDKNIPDDARRIGMRKWLGIEPLTLDDAIAVSEENGQRWELTGSGWLKGLCWFASATRGGKNADLPIYTVNERGERSAIPGMTYHYPPTKAAV